MPIYEYLCDTCGKITSALQRMSDDPLEQCPSGDGGGLKRILSAHSVGGVASGAEGLSCDRPEVNVGGCGGCGQAGTGCS